MRFLNRTYSLLLCASIFLLDFGGSLHAMVTPNRNRFLNRKSWYQKDHYQLLMALALTGGFSFLRSRFQSKVQKPFTPMGPLSSPKPKTKTPTVPKQVNEKAYRENLTVPKWDKFPIPADLKLKQYDLFHMRSPYQIGPSCGWFQIFNAKALQDIIEKELPLTAYNVHRMVLKTLVPYARKNEQSLRKLLGVVKILSGTTMEYTHLLAKHFGIKNFYSVRLRTDGSIEASSEKQHSIYAKAPSYPIDNDQSCIYNFADCKELLKIVKADPFPIKHILLSVRWGKFCHAVLITIVNRGKKKPLILYLDSNNSLLSGKNCEPDMKMESMLIKKCIAMLDGV